MLREPGRYRVEAVTASKNAKALAKLARDLSARVAAIADPKFYPELKDALAGSGIAAAAGMEAVVEAAQRPADWVMAAISGAAGLQPTLAAVARGAMVALANKECLVCAGTLFMQRASAAGATVLPADSEHNAIFQALGANQKDDLHRIILTASGGPFRTWSPEQIRTATVEQALRHPNWAMGQKVTIDSATMMNKGLELIEAHHLFALPSDPNRRARASAIDRAWAGRIPRRLDDRATLVAGYARADRALSGVAGTDRRVSAAARSRQDRNSDVRGAGSGAVSRVAGRTRRDGRRQRRDDNSECGK